MKKYSKNIFISLLVVVMIICATIIGIYYYKLYRADKSNEKLKKEVIVKEDTSDDKPTIPIDFDELQKENPDIYAWIKIPGTVIDYPILRNEEDTDYYLNHTVEKVEGLPGSIYTQNANAPDFSDPVTVIYGHNMRNDTMFGELHNYEDEAFFHENNTVIIYTPEHILTYQIFASVMYNDSLILDSFSLDTDQGFQSYLDSIYESSSDKNNFNNDISVTTKDKIITLSTCVANQSNKRYLVQAILIDTQ